MERDGACTRFSVVLDPLIWVSDHQMAVQEGSSVLSQGGDHGGAYGEVGDEVPVHTTSARE